MSYKDYLRKKQARAALVEEEESDSPSTGKDLDFGPIDEDTPSTKPFNLKSKTKKGKMVRNVALVGVRSILKELAFYAHRGIDRED